MQYTHRFSVFHSDLPSVGEILVVKVLGIEDILARVSLLEYGDREAILPISEVSKKRIRSLRKLLKVDQEVTVQVTNTDNGQVGVSMCGIRHEEEVTAMSRLRKSRTAHTVFHRVSVCTGFPVDDLVKMLTARNPDVHPWDLLQNITSEPSDIPPPMLQALKDELKKRASPTSQTSRNSAEVEVLAYKSGVAGIKAAFAKALEPWEGRVTAVNVGSPRYLITSTSEDPNCLEQVLKALQRQAVPGELFVNVHASITPGKE